MSNLIRKRGDTYPIERELVNEFNLPIDITGNAFTLSVSTKAEPVTASYLFQETGTITDAVNGLFEFSFINNGDYVGKYYYDIQMTNGAIIRTLESGTITYEQDITK